MSVYTTVEPAQLEAFLKRYDIGKANAFGPIENGITNTNYYLDTDAGRFVLTLYEHHGDDELDYILGLQQHLANQGVRCACPVGDRRGDHYSTLNDRPAAIIERVAGDVVPEPGPEHCARIGTELARFHQAGQEYANHRHNPRGTDWWLVVRDMLDAELEPEDRKLIDATIRDYQALAQDDLPRGAIHADLFHDNALFDGDTLAGIIDFDYACSDSFVFDLAVTLNDWCIDVQGALVPSRVDAILAAYQRLRPLTEPELRSFALMLRVAALRFWLSRLYDRAFPLHGTHTFIKTPDVFRRLLVLRSAQADELTELFRS